MTRELILATAKKHWQPGWQNTTWDDAMYNNEWRCLVLGKPSRGCTASDDGLQTRVSESAVTCSSKARDVQGL
jgi:hypothetical protein